MNIERSALISIILPAYNAERTLAESVDSVLAQTYDKIELVIIDDGSTDGTRTIAENYAQKDCRVKVLCNEVNIGVLKTRMRGVRFAMGQWIAFIDSDDLWHPDKLKKQMLLQKRTGSVLTYCASGFIGSDGNEISWVMHVPPKVDYKRLLKQNVIPNSSVVIKKEIFLKYSPFSEDQRDMHEDYACWLLILKDGHDASGIDEPLLTYRIHKHSMTGNKLHSAMLNLSTYRYIGLGFFQSAYYMVCYAVRGIIKYSHLR